MPAPVRQTYATGKGVIGEAEKPDAPLTYATEQGDVQYRLCGGGLDCLKAHAGILVCRHAISPLALVREMTRRYGCAPWCLSC